ncbi:MAG TPA: hypothetical protein VMN37_08030 [Gemmatimonadales bacterium]|nr:hypothetical protein [Gemmatimonadales bacterium]
MDGVRALLRGSIDYAGLFPPAALDLPAAVANYAEYLRSPDAWALGRFVVPASRLAELEEVAADVAPSAPSADAWPLAVLLADASREEIDGLGEFNCRHAAAGAAAMSGDVAEVKAGTVAAVERIGVALPPYLRAYIEIPIAADPAPLLEAIARTGARAKVRTGGVTPDAFPPAPDLARFLAGCARAGVAFKATAGLHHPLRAEYRLTYRPDSPTGTMYGFLNVFLAAAFLREGMDQADAVRLLEERDPGAIRFGAGGVQWRGHRLETAALQRAREEGMVSFGSCSFTEPVGELRSLGML